MKDPGEFVMPLGKYRGMTLDEIGSEDEERDCQQHAVVDAADHLLHENDVGEASEIGLLDEQCRHSDHEKHLEAENQHDSADDDDQPDHDGGYPVCSGSG